jgi:adenosylcobinamide-GDP ribazoletransferase
MSDISPKEDERVGQFRPFAELIFSLAFLSRLPIPFARTLDPPPLSQSMRFFAIAGGLIGAANGLFLAGLHWFHVPHLIAAALACIFGIMLTGGLHEDGLTDSADGLFGGKSREQRLEIMRDSRIGSYGALALFSSLLVRVAAYDTLANLPALVLVPLVAAAGSFSRAMLVDLLWATRPARNDGLSVFAGRPGRNAALFAIACGGALTVAAGLNIKPESGIIAVLAAAAVTGLIRRYAMRQIGGQTGDICGAAQVLVEIVMLVIFASMLG